MHTKASVKKRSFRLVWPSTSRCYRIESDFSRKMYLSITDLTFVTLTRLQVLKRTTLCFVPISASLRFQGRPKGMESSITISNILAVFLIMRVSVYPVSYPFKHHLMNGYWQSTSIKQNICMPALIKLQSLGFTNSRQWKYHKRYSCIGLVTCILV